MGVFDQFIPFSDYESAMKDILDLKQDDSIAKETEAYWLSKLIGFQHPFLFHAIQSIYENPNITTAKLSDESGVSQKTLIKHFKMHLCKTPSEYKKILRFRKALNENEVNHKLTEIAYTSNFFDQSHMISNFRSLTGFTPKYFFKHISSFDRNNRTWIFLKD